MLFGRGSEVFRRFLSVCAGCFFAFDVAPGHCLCVSGSGPSLSLPCAGHLFLRLLANFLQASAQAVPFSVEFQFIRHPVRHVGNVDQPCSLPGSQKGDRNVVMPVVTTKFAGRWRRSRPRAMRLRITKRDFAPSSVRLCRPANSVWWSRIAQDGSARPYSGVEFILLSALRSDATPARSQTSQLLRPPGRIGSQFAARQRGDEGGAGSPTAWRPEADL